MQYDRRFKLTDKVSLVKEYGLDLYDPNWFGVIDNNNKVVVPLGYTDIQISNDKSVFICEAHKKFDVYNDDGKMLAEGLDSAKFVRKNNENNFVITNKDNKFGLIDSNGKELLECKYNNVKDLDNGYVACKNNDKFALFDKSGKQITPFEFDNCYDAKDNLIFCVKNGKSGVIDNNLKTIIPFEYDSLRCCNENGISIAKKDNKCGCIDLNNNIIVDFKYDIMYSDDNGFIRSLNSPSKNSQYGLYNQFGQMIADCKYESIGNLDEYVKRYFPVKKDGKVGYIDFEGKQYYGTDAINVKYFIQYNKIKCYKEKYFNSELRKLKRERNKELAIYAKQIKNDNKNIDYENFEKENG